MVTYVRFPQETLSLTTITIEVSRKEGEMATHNSSGDLLEQSATFGAMTEGTALDWKIIAAHNQHLAADVASRVIDHLKLLEGIMADSRSIDLSIHSRPLPAPTGPTNLTSTLFALSSTTSATHSVLTITQTSL